MSGLQVPCEIILIDLADVSGVDLDGQVSRIRYSEVSKTGPSEVSRAS